MQVAVWARLQSAAFPPLGKAGELPRTWAQSPELSQATKSADSGPPCPSPSATEKGPTSPTLFAEDPRPSLDLAKYPPGTREVEPRDSPPPHLEEASLNSFSSMPPHAHVLPDGERPPSSGPHTLPLTPRPGSRQTSTSNPTEEPRGSSRESGVQGGPSTSPLAPPAAQGLSPLWGPQSALSPSLPACLSPVG